MVATFVERTTAKQHPTRNIEVQKCWFAGMDSGLRLLSLARKKIEVETQTLER
jgi:hypothetical protein